MRRRLRSLQLCLQMLSPFLNLPNYNPATVQQISLLNLLTLPEQVSHMTS